MGEGKEGGERLTEWEDRGRERQREPGNRVESEEAGMVVGKEERREKKGKRELIKLRKLAVHVASDKDNTTLPRKQL